MDRDLVICNGEVVQDAKRLQKRLYQRKIHEIQRQIAALDLEDDDPSGSDPGVALGSGYDPAPPKSVTGPVLAQPIVGSDLGRAPPLAGSGLDPAPPKAGSGCVPASGKAVVDLASHFLNAQGEWCPRPPPGKPPAEVLAEIAPPGPPTPKMSGKTPPAWALQPAPDKAYAPKSIPAWAKPPAAKPPPASAANWLRARATDDDAATDVDVYRTPSVAGDTVAEPSGCDPRVAPPAPAP